jgi:hypothetical protein
MYMHLCQLIKLKLVNLTRELVVLASADKLYLVQ